MEFEESKLGVDAVATLELHHVDVEVGDDEGFTFAVGEFYLADDVSVAVSNENGLRVPFVVDLRFRIEIFSAMIFQ